jgi:hypothetical protein
VDYLYNGHPKFGNTYHLITYCQRQHIREVQSFKKYNLGVKFQNNNGIRAFWNKFNIALRTTF